MSAFVPPAGLANAANMNRGWVTKAAQLGLVNTSALDGEDLIVVRVFAFVDQLVWPGERRSRSASRSMEPWQSLAVNAARDAARDPQTNLDSILWIMSDGVELTHSPGAHAAFLVNSRSIRSGFVGMPIGEWVAELPPHLETIFHWPRQLLSENLALSDGVEVHITAFSTIRGQITAFCGSPRGLEAPAVKAIRNHVLTRNPGVNIRVVERPLHAHAAATAPWHELYELPGDGLVRRPLAFQALLDEYGPQLKHLGAVKESTVRRRSTG
ncbi:hypothetical protein [Streptomyces sp. NPDC050485]|uniref:hypothetical protein n=1 Tax=Streptomyces sp. NPDC050485 TaxID=3365617 RepID=UPI0037A2BD00